jgi:hypothetical protein
MGWNRKVFALTSAVALGGLAWQLSTSAQQAPADRSRFEFLIVQSFDAQYLGDTPGHLGRGGGLGKTIPNVALGDPVYHEDTRIGRISQVTWDRTKESLEVEIDPEPFIRISVGETVWISLTGPAAAREKSLR